MLLMLICCPFVIVISYSARKIVSKGFNLIVLLWNSCFSYVISCNVSFLLLLVGCLCYNYNFAITFSHFFHISRSVTLCFPLSVHLSLIVLRLRLHALNTKNKTKHSLSTVSWIFRECLLLINYCYLIENVL